MIFFRRFFVSHYRKTSQGNPSVFQKFSGIEKIMDKKDGVVGISSFSVRMFLSHSEEKNHTGILQCFI